MGRRHRRRHGRNNNGSAAANGSRGGIATTTMNPSILASLQAQRKREEERLAAEQPLSSEVKETAPRSIKGYRWDENKKRYYKLQRHEKIRKRASSEPSVSSSYKPTTVTKLFKLREINGHLRQDELAMRLKTIKCIIKNDNDNSCMTRNVISNFKIHPLMFNHQQHHLFSITSPGSSTILFKYYDKASREICQTFEQPAANYWSQTITSMDWNNTSSQNAQLLVTSIPNISSNSSTQSKMSQVDIMHPFRNQTMNVCKKPFDIWSGIRNKYDAGFQKISLGFGTASNSMAAVADINTMSLLECPNPPSKSDVFAQDHSDSGNVLWNGTRDGSVWAWDTRSPMTTKVVLTTPSSPSSSIVHLKALHNDYSILVSTSNESLVQIDKRRTTTTSGIVLQYQEGLASSINTNVGISRPRFCTTNSDTLLTSCGSTNGLIKTFSVRTGEIVCQKPVIPGGISPTSRSFYTLDSCEAEDSSTIWIASEKYGLLQMS